MSKKLILLILFSLVFLLLWQWGLQLFSEARLAAGQTSLEAFIPLPSTVLKTFIDQWDLIGSELIYTLVRATLGLVLGASIGWIFASMLVFLPRLRNVLEPLLYGINAFPLVGFAPVIILIFGQGSLTAIVFVAALICFFPTFIQIDYAYQKTNKALLDVLKVLRATTFQRFLKVQLPLAIPYLFVALRLSIPAAFVGSMLGEWLGTKHGIGQLVTVSLYQLNPGMLYAALIAVTITSLFVVGLIKIIEKKVTCWQFLA